MSDIKEKIEMELKPYETICEELTSHLKQMITGQGEYDPQEILSVAKTLGEIVDVKKDIVEMCYKKQIMEAMEESEFGEDYDEEGPVMRRGYRGQPRRANGQYMSRRSYKPSMYDEPIYMLDAEMYRKYPASEMRDMDRSKGVMYYPYGANNGSNSGSSNMGYQRGYEDGRREAENSSRYMRTRRGYEESKMMHNDNSNESKQANAKELEKWMKSSYDELESVVKKDGMVSNEEKTVLNTYGQKIMNLAK